MSFLSEVQMVPGAALERARSATALISALSPLLDPTLPTPSPHQAARVQRAALKLVEAALQEAGADATRYVGFGWAALYVGMPPKEFHALCEAGEGPQCILIEGKAAFTPDALDTWVEQLACGDAAA